MRSTSGNNKALDANAARKCISTILKSGQTSFSRHAREEMVKDNLTEVDVVNVLRGGRITEPAEEVGGTWRYRVHTNTIWAVVAFRSEMELVVVTVWRKR